MTNEIVKQDAQEVQKPLAWFINTIGMVTTSKAERNKWVKQGHSVIELGDMSALRKENAALRAQVADLKASGKAIIASEMNRTAEVIALRDQVAEMKGGAA